MQNFRLQISSSYQQLYYSTSVKYLDAALQTKLSCWLTECQENYPFIFYGETVGVSKFGICYILYFTSYRMYAICTFAFHLNILILDFSVPRYLNHGKNQGMLFKHFACLKRLFRDIISGQFLEKQIFSFFKTTP